MRALPRLSWVLSVTAALGLCTPFVIVSEVKARAPKVRTDYVFPHKCVQQEQPDQFNRMVVTNICDQELAISYEIRDETGRSRGESGGWFTPGWRATFNIPPSWCKPLECKRFKWVFLRAVPRDVKPSPTKPTFELCIKMHLIDGSADITNVCDYEVRANYRLWTGNQFLEHQAYRLGPGGKARLRFGPCRPLDGCSPRWEPFTIERM